MAAQKQVKSEYFAALDGFRGILAILIALYHTMWRSHVNSSELFNNGPVLVDIFFVFSGFLMFYLYDGKIGSGKQGRAFIKRRFARIYPLHFFMLIVALLYAFARLVAHWVGLATHSSGEILPFEHGASETIWTFLSNLMLTHSMGLHDHLSYNMPSWTVSVEFWAYFVFAGMMLWARPKKPWHFGIIAALIGLNYWVLSTLKPDMNFHYDLGFWRCLGGFFTGVLVAFAYRTIKPHYARVKNSIRPKTFLPIATLIEFTALFVMTGFVIYFPGRAQFFIAPVAFIFVLGFAFDMGLISKLLSKRPFRYIAKISYSIYMVHILVSLFFSIGIELFFPKYFGPLWNATQIGGDVLLIPYIAFVILFSHFTYKYIEMPGRRALLVYNPKERYQNLLTRLNGRRA